MPCFSFGEDKQVRNLDFYKGINFKEVKEEIFRKAKHNEVAMEEREDDPIPPFQKRQWESYS